MLLALFVACAVAISCKDESGNNVDWWIAMKIPEGQCESSLTAEVPTAVLLL